jgi:hypothetical protein
VYPQQLPEPEGAFLQQLRNALRLPEQADEDQAFGVAASARLRARLIAEAATMLGAPGSGEGTVEQEPPPAAQCVPNWYRPRSRRRSFRAERRLHRCAGWRSVWQGDLAQPARGVRVIAAGHGHLQGQHLQRHDLLDGCHDLRDGGQG